MFYSKLLEPLIVHDDQIIFKPLWIGFESCSVLMIQAQELLEGSKVLDWLIEHAEITYVPKQS